MARMLLVEIAMSASVMFKFVKPPTPCRIVERSWGTAGFDTSIKLIAEESFATTTRRFPENFNCLGPARLLKPLKPS